MGMKGEGGYFLEYLDKKGAPSKSSQSFKNKGVVSLLCVLGYVGCASIIFLSL